jgi:hypothetical protein
MKVSRTKCLVEIWNPMNKECPRYLEATIAINDEVPKVTDNYMMERKY